MNEGTGRVFDVGLEILDRQIVDADGRLAGKVDDLELVFPRRGAARRTSSRSSPARGRSPADSAAGSERGSRRPRAGFTTSARPGRRAYRSPS
jgi:hypothetical protein